MIQSGGLSHSLEPLKSTLLSVPFANFMARPSASQRETNVWDNCRFWFVPLKPFSLKKSKMTLPLGTIPQRPSGFMIFSLRVSMCLQRCFPVKFNSFARPRSSLSSSESSYRTPFVSLLLHVCCQDDFSRHYLINTKICEVDIRYFQLSSGPKAVRCLAKAIWRLWLGIFFSCVAMNWSKKNSQTTNQKWNERERDLKSGINQVLNYKRSNFSVSDGGRIK